MIDKESSFYKRSAFMVQMIPLISREKCFALKGGTAINYFIRDLPRLSVDIDLTYVPIEDRELSLRSLHDALERIAERITKTISGVQILRSSDSGRTFKLIIKNPDGIVKIEPNTIVRGTLLPVEIRKVTKTVVELFEVAPSMQVLSISELYGGKLCAAMGRQHPRDLFDVKILLEHEGITKEIIKAFVVYLASSPRPMNELLKPNLKDMRRVFDKEFFGMTSMDVKYEALVDTRKTMMETIRKGLSGDQRKFLLSLKEGEPDWSLAGWPNVERLPAIQWKLANIRKMDKGKHKKMVQNLKQALAL